MENIHSSCFRSSWPSQHKYYAQRYEGKKSTAIEILVRKRFSVQGLNRKARRHECVQVGK